MEEKLFKVALAWEKAEKPVVFTGAGMSAESGVPTFRGQEGLWRKFDVEKAAYLDSFLDDPEPFWEMTRELLLKKQVKPNAGHFALAKLEREGFLQGIITQNIDGLHQKAGSRRVFELHGSMEKLDCLDCKKVYDWEGVLKGVEKGEVKCICGSKKVKPRLVFFGESLPQKVLEKASELVEDCDLMIVIGSSLQVYPAASLPQIAFHKGAEMVLINSEKTPFDYYFNWIFREAAGKVLPELEEKILGGNQK